MTESRQIKWQKERRAKGLCIICSGPGAVHEKGKRVGQRSQYCKKHLIAKREMQRKTLGSKKRHNSISYQLDDQNEG